MPDRPLIRDVDEACNAIVAAMPELKSNLEWAVIVARKDSSESAVVRTMSHETMTRFLERDK